MEVAKNLGPGSKTATEKKEGPGVGGKKGQKGKGGEQSKILPEGSQYWASGQKGSVKKKRNHEVANFCNPKIKVGCKTRSR